MIEKAQSSEFPRGGGERPDARLAGDEEPEFRAAMNEFEAIITDTVDINTRGGGHFQLMPGRYRVAIERNGGAMLVRIDIKGAAQIYLTPVQWGILHAARFIERQ